MYGKIFESMYSGTLYGQWEAIVTFQQLIVLSDSDGVVDMTPPAIAATTSIPLEIINKGLEDLQKADEYSRSDGQDGRRIVLVDPPRPWGWVIVNHKYYRDLASREDKKEKDRVRIAEKRSKNKDVAGCRNKSQMSPIQDANTDANTTNNNGQKTAFDLFWEAYPRKVKKKRAREIWKAKKLEVKCFDILVDITTRLCEHAPWKRGFIPHPTTYLNGELWNDEIEKEDIVDKKKNGACVPSYKDEAALTAFGKKHGILPKAGENYFKYAQRLAVEVKV